ncbi:MAG: M48 family metallopeptidase [bacterium]
MTAMHYTVFFLTLLAAYTATRLWLNLRQTRYVSAHRDTVPEEFRGKISLDAHQKAADYTLEKLRFGRLMGIFDALILLGWTLGGGLQWVYEMALRVGLDDLATGTLTIILVALISGLLELPGSIYRTFVIEDKYGFNRTTPRVMALDTLKGTAVSLVIGTPIIMLILWLMNSAGTNWWIWAWLAFFGFSLFISWAYPTFIAPLFNKFTPLDNQELADAINNLLEKSGFQSKGIFVMDGSRRSGHGNAYFTGFGKNKRIVFYDTLLDSLSNDQVIAVLAHELGHFHHKHIIKGMALSTLVTLAGFALLAWLLPQEAFFQGLGVQTGNTALALILFSMVIPLATYFIEPVMAWWSRKHEFEADAYAAHQANPLELITALVTMYKDNASTLTPDRLYSRFYDSHPPALERIEHLKSFIPSSS